MLPRVAAYPPLVCLSVLCHSMQPHENKPQKCQNVKYSLASQSRLSSQPQLKLEIQKHFALEFSKKTQQKQQTKAAAALGKDLCKKKTLNQVKMSHKLQINFSEESSKPYLQHL